MNWSELNWKTLDRLREGFLSGGAAKGPYWQSLEDLAHYNFTYAERIGWKWDAVLDELKARGWAPRGGTLLDWGCGSGVAGRRVMAAFGVDRFDSLLLWDHSPIAIEFSEIRALQRFPGLNTCSVTPGYLEGASPIGLLVLSHVLNELSEPDLVELRRLILRSETVLWVEPGTHEVARGLQMIRDSLLSEFDMIAPCPHAKRCPMLVGEENERHWCHFFAAPPSDIFSDSNWVKFGQRAGIDLRSLPYAFMALQRKATPMAEHRPPSPASEASTTSIPGPSPVSEARVLGRVIGRAKHMKPYARLLGCDANGLGEFTVPKRDAASLYKDLERTKAPLVYQWRREGDKIVEGQRLQIPE